MSDFHSQYQPLTAGAGLVDFRSRTRIRLTGRDRASFLHNMCTNDVRSLEPGRGCEAFVTNVQGKVLGHVFVFCEPDSLLLETVPAQAEKLHSHLDRYVIREDVQLEDVTGATSEWLLSGPRAVEILSKVTQAEPPQARLAHTFETVGGMPVVLRRVDFAGPSGFLIQSETRHADALRAILEEAGAKLCGDEAFEAARIEAGTPLYGQDISEANLPQEVGRDARAISFNKGCYLGQETVARIDALGHVNRMLAGVRFEASEVPPVGTELSIEGKAVGKITSATHSPKLGAPLALAYVRRGHNQPGTRLESAVGNAQVVALPVELSNPG